MIARQTEGGRSWAELARLDPLAAVLDPADARGGKNRLIDRVQRGALARVVGDVRGESALDFGCGTGRLSEWLVRRGALVDGVDVTPEMVAVASTRVPGARFQAVDGKTLPFPDECFHLVITAGVLQYYVDRETGVARELARVLRPNARLLAVEHETESDIGRGGTAAAYGRMFSAAGLTVADVVRVRISDSRIVGHVARRPRLSRMPFLPRLVRAEAARRRYEALSGGRYADTLFVVVKAE